MRVVFVNNTPLVKHHLDQVKEVYTTVITYDKSPENKNELVARAKDADVIVSNWYPIADEEIAKLKDLKYICIASTHSSYIDIESAINNNITVCNIKDYCIESVAQHTVGLILDSSKRISPSHFDLKKNNVWMPKEHVGMELWGKTLGIIGCGKIGSLVANVMKNGFGMKIIKYTSKSSRDDLMNLLRTSDVITMNLPLHRSTKHILGDYELNQLKDKVILVNTGKAATICKGSLVRKIKSSQMIYATDVFHQEPVETNDELLSLKNVIVTPHTAWNTQETKDRISQKICENLLSISHGNPINLCEAQKDTTDRKISQSFSHFLND